MKNVEVYLNDVLESISAIEEYVKELTEEDFYSNRQTQDALNELGEIFVREGNKNDCKEH